MGSRSRPAFSPPTRGFNIVLVSSRDAREYGGLIAASGALGFVAKSDLSGDILRSLLG